MAEDHVERVSETSAGDATPSPESTSQAQSNAKPNASAIAGVTEALASLSIHNPPDSDASAATGTNQVTTTVGEATSSAPENEMVNEQPVVDECDGDSNTERVKGRVKWFNVNRGYGFISRSGQSDVFVYQDVIKKEGYRTLGEGEEVEMVVQTAEKGPEAKQVTGPGGIDVVGSVRSRANKKKVNKCYNCGRLGHIAMDCSQPPMPKKCHICYSENHLKAACPNKMRYYPFQFVDPVNVPSNAPSAYHLDASQLSRAFQRKHNPHGVIYTSNPVKVTMPQNAMTRTAHQVPQQHYGTVNYTPPVVSMATLSATTATTNDPIVHAGAAMPALSVAAHHPAADYSYLRSQAGMQARNTKGLQQQMMAPGLGHPVATLIRPAEGGYSYASASVPSVNQQHVAGIQTQAAAASHGGINYYTPVQDVYPYQMAEGQIADVALYPVPAAVTNSSLNGIPAASIFNVPHYPGNELRHGGAYNGY